jgi:dihydrofolate reductase
MASRVRVYIACSLDGFIAGPGDDLSFLEQAQSLFSPPSEDSNNTGIQYPEFMSEVGALLMGRKTFDVVDGFDMPWPYGDTPVLVATTRSLEVPVASVKAVSGSIAELLTQAKESAGDKDVYLDGGRLIRSALEEGLVDELIVTQIPVILGEGIPLFAGIGKEQWIEIKTVQRFNQAGMQWVGVPRERPE